MQWNASHLRKPPMKKMKKMVAKKNNTCGIQPLLRLLAVDLPLLETWCAADAQNPRTCACIEQSIAAIGATTGAGFHDELCRSCAHLTASLLLCCCLHHIDMRCAMLCLQVNPTNETSLEEQPQRQPQPPCQQLRRQAPNLFAAQPNALHAPNRSGEPSTAPTCPPACMRCHAWLMLLVRSISYSWTAFHQSLQCHM